jgi:8-oxo-dGTP diphosphatase
VLLNADPASVSACGADGVHLNSTRLMQTRTRPLPQEFFVGASCHNELECRQAQAIGADLIVLGPVAPTRTHPGLVPLGWEMFRHLSATAAPAVYALGGLDAGDLPRARAYGAHGVSMISGLWDAADVTAEVERCVVG